MTWARVLAYPCAHPFVERLDGPTARLVHTEVGAGVDPLDPEWVELHAMDWDVAHLHLGRHCDGVGDTPTAQVVEVVAAQRRAGVPVAVTVHDLDPAGRVVELLRALGGEVSAVLATSGSCAEALQAELGRPVRTIPHGPVLEDRVRQRLRGHRSILRLEDHPVLLVAGDLPSTLRWEAAIEALDRSTVGRSLRIRVHHDLRDRVLAVVGERPWVQVEGYDPGYDLDLPRAVAESSILLHPDVEGMDPRLLELAADVGTPVVCTDAGHAWRQQPATGVPLVDGDVDVQGLADALDAPIAHRPTVREVDRERDAYAFRCHHQRLYHRLLLGRAAGVVDLTDDEPAATAPRPTGSRGGHRGEVTSHAVRHRSSRPRPRTGGLAGA